MIENIPKDLQNSLVETKIRELFHSIFGKTRKVGHETIKPIVKVAVVSDYQESFKLVQELKLAAGKFKGCFKRNEEEREANPAEFKRLTMKKRQSGCCCFGSFIEVDAEEYYSNQIEDLMLNIRRTEQ